MRHAIVNVVSLVSTLVFCSALLAGVLPQFASISVEPGELVEQAIDLDRSSGVRVEIKLIEPPQGARITLSDQGQLILQWRTDVNLPAHTALTIQARDLDSQSIVDTSILLVSNSQISNSQIRNPFETAIVLPEASQKNATIILDPMANQIVSSGQAVMIPINASSSDDKAPLISIDRVPRNATFDKGLLRGYTFFWQTGDLDEGEHVFRITARHPSEDAVPATALLTVFIGDPSVNKTLPLTTTN